MSYFHLHDKHLVLEDRTIVDLHLQRALFEANSHFFNVAIETGDYYGFVLATCQSRPELLLSCEWCL